MWAWIGLGSTVYRVLDFGAMASVLPGMCAEGRAHKYVH